ncbi:MAG: L-ribulose-5-phosphate 4-epimerase [Thermoguttaceae bacterium]|nr:L-ribulose-5-phosphate 4-epimerase [Thermoguttaceae bacterium]MBR5758277.1 L-ribulose-5-phosphate 4-epimerase [Thermoguttaceae bacterium]
MGKLKEDVFEANLELVRRGLVLYTWGNVSGIDRERGLVVIKPSGVSYDVMKSDDMVVLDLATGSVVEGSLRPSTDAPTHLVFYRAFANIGGVVHTHSSHAVAWAQAQRDIPIVGTTCADYFYQSIPCARALTREEIAENYEKATGDAIVEAFRERGIDPDSTPGALARNHGPFTWGKSPADAVYNAVVLEETSKTALMTAILNPALPVDEALVEKHYSRKHGPNAYYGQK